MTLPRGAQKMILPQQLDLWSLFAIVFGWGLVPFYGVESHAVRTLNQNKLGWQCAVTFTFFQSKQHSIWCLGDKVCMDVQQFAWPLQRHPGGHTTLSLQILLTISWMHYKYCWNKYCLNANLRIKVNILYGQETPSLLDTLCWSFLR